MLTVAAVDHTLLVEARVRIRYRRAYAACQFNSTRLIDRIAPRSTCHHSWFVGSELQRVKESPSFALAGRYWESPPSMLEAVAGWLSARS
jgi:hypothetical protein